MNKFLAALPLVFASVALSPAQAHDIPPCSKIERLHDANLFDYQGLCDTGSKIAAKLVGVGSLDEESLSSRINLIESGMRSGNVKPRSRLALSVDEAKHALKEMQAYKHVNNQRPGL